MADYDVISLSSDSSRPSSPFINVSEVFNESEKNCEISSVNLHCAKNNISPLKIINPSKTRIIHTLSESEDSEDESSARSSSRDEISCRELNRLLEKYSGNKNIERVLGEDNTLDDSNVIQGPVQTSPTKEKTKKRHERGLNTKLSKAERMEEKQQKQREKEQQKAEKLAAKELQNYMKPGNCLKYITVMMDSSLAMCPFSGALIAAVQNTESKYHMAPHNVPHTIFWKRELPGPRDKEENHIVVIWDWQAVIPAIKNHSLCSEIQVIQDQYLGKSIYLVIYGLNGYFSYIKSKRRNNSGDIPKRRRKESGGTEFPYVTRKEIEEELIELQIMTNCNHRLIESPDDLGQLIVQITKAIAETPFKLDKQRRELESLEWFAVGDSRDCVTVDKAGNGLLRLWQQQLCQFNLAGHDVAQAIASVYPSPQALLTAYDKCSSQKEAEELLKDIHVRRCQGPLTSSRRIGPELSKKIYTFFCSADGETCLSQEQ